MGTHILGPETPRPFSVISEKFMNRLQAQTSADASCLRNRFSFGADYERALCSAVHKHLELDTDDRLCYVGDEESSIVPLLVERFCLVKDVVSVQPGHIHYEETPGGERRIPIRIPNVGADEFFDKESKKFGNPQFSKILMRDALQYIADEALRDCSRVKSAASIDNLEKTASGTLQSTSQSDERTLQLLPGLKTTSSVDWLDEPRLDSSDGSINQSLSNLLSITQESKSSLTGPSTAGRPADDLQTIINNMLLTLTAQGRLLFIHRPLELNTLPLPGEARRRLGELDGSFERLLMVLQTCGLDVHWQIESLRVVMPRSQWIDMLRHRHYPPQLRTLSDRQVADTLRELSEGILKYDTGAPDSIEFTDRLLFVTACRSQTQYPVMTRLREVRHTETSTSNNDSVTSRITTMTSHQRSVDQKGGAGVFEMPVTPDILGLVKEKMRQDRISRPKKSNYT